MKLLFKQRFFSWLDSYDIFDEQGNTAYFVKGELSFGHCLHILDVNGVHVGTVKQKVFTFMPKFEIYQNEQYIGCISKEFQLFQSKYHIEFNGWNVRGNFMEWDYEILDSTGRLIARISKEIFHLTDTYSLDILNPSDALYVLMVVLAIDAEKCSQN